MYKQQKRYNTAMNRFSDFKLGMASQLARFLSFFFSVVFLISATMYIGE